jgi:DNA polymerase V
VRNLSVSYTILIPIGARMKSNVKHEITHLVNSGGPATLPAMKAICGLFGLAEDYLEEYQSLDERFIKNRVSTFFFQATSNSMEPLIFEKDILIVDRSLPLTPGCIIIASLGGQFVCKRFARQQGFIILRSENPVYKDVVVTEEMEMTVFGVVTGIARELV